MMRQLLQLKRLPDPAVSEPAPFAGAGLLHYLKGTSEQVWLNLG